MPGCSGRDNRALLLIRIALLRMMRFFHEEGTNQGNDSGCKQEEEYRSIGDKGILIGFGFPIQIKDLAQERHEDSAAEEGKQIDRTDTGTRDLNREKLFRGSETHDHNRRRADRKQEEPRIKNRFRHIRGKNTEKQKKSRQCGGTQENGFFPAFQYLFRKQAQDWAADDHAPCNHTQDGSGLRFRHAVGMHQIRTAPQAPKAEKNAAVEEKPDSNRPKISFRYNPSCSFPEANLCLLSRRLCLMIDLGNERPALVGRVIANNQPDQQDEQNRAAADQLKREPPSKPGRHQAQQPGSRQDARPAHGVEDARHQGKFTRAEPLGQDFHGGDKDHRDAQANHDPGQESDFDSASQPEKKTADRRQQQENRNGFSRPDRIGKQTRGKLHRSVAIEIDRTKKAQNTTRDFKILGNILGDDRHGKPMEINKQIRHSQDDKNEPPIRQHLPDACFVQVFRIVGIIERCIHAESVYWAYSGLTA